jgi:hypothetical protein
MFSRGYFWPDLHNLYISLEAEGESHPSRLDHILEELQRFPPAVRDELAADLAELSRALSDLADLVLDPSQELNSSASRSLIRS